MLGGGVVDGSFVLIGGDPGIGKSTLMLQMAHKLASSGHEGPLCERRRVGPAARRCVHDRLGIDSDGIMVYPEVVLERIRDEIDEHEPRYRHHRFHPVRSFHPRSRPLPGVFRR
ncbi:MAG: DNA repair protein RadA [Candidatus Moduliflexus flocculans]|nr:DNA repair protein RadA [Candidatus Moduliflexus flocculans]